MTTGPQKRKGPKPSGAAARKAAPGAKPKVAAEGGGAKPRISAGASITDASGGPLALNSLFSWLGDVVEQLGEVAEKAEKFKESQIHRHGEFKVRGMGEKARGVYGVSVKMGLGGEPAFESFGNIHPTAKGPEVSEVREPLVDVFDEDKEVLVVAELPGASEKDISVKIAKNHLSLSAEGDYRYAKEVTLPTKVDPEPVRRVYRNGLLELRLAKA